MNEFWYTFLVSWNLCAVLISNGINWFLPGIYTPAYEITSCVPQDNSLKRNFENTAILILLTLAVYSVIFVQIKLFKHDYQLLVVNPETNVITATNQSTKAKVMADLTLTLTFGPILFLMFLFGITYFLDKIGPNPGIVYSKFPHTLMIQLIYLVMYPFANNIFVGTFYIKNKHVINVLIINTECKVREPWSSG